MKHLHTCYPTTCGRREEIAQGISRGCKPPNQTHPKRCLLFNTWQWRRESGRVVRQTSFQQAGQAPWQIELKLQNLFYFLSSKRMWALSWISHPVPPASWGTVLRAAHPALPCPSLCEAAGPSEKGSGVDSKPGGWRFWGNTEELQAFA